MGIQQELPGHQPHQALLHFQHVLARRNPRSVRYPEDVGIHRHCRLPERGVQNHVGGLAAHTRKGFQVFPVVRNFPAVFFNQRTTGLDHVLGLAVKQPDGLDVFLQAIHSQREDFFGCVGYGV